MCFLGGGNFSYSQIVPYLFRKAFTRRNSIVDRSHSNHNSTENADAESNKKFIESELRLTPQMESSGWAKNIQEKWKYLILGPYLN